MSHSPQDELDTAMLDILDGSPAGPLFASRVKRACTEVLRRRGLDATVGVLDGGRFVRIRIRRADRVETIRLSLDALQ